MTFLVQKHAGAVAASLPLTARVENALVSYCRYLGKLFVPVNLSVHYPYPDHWPMTAVLFSALLLLAISIFTIALRHGRPWLPVGWFWFIGTLVPAIGLVQVGVQSMADRYTYIPSMGLLVMLVWGVHDLTRRWRQQAAGLTVACAASALVCLAITHRQTGYWKDNEPLFRHALAVTENNWIAENDLGAALLHPGHYDEAVEHLDQSIKIYPYSNDSHNNLGIALKATGHLDDAIAEYQRAIQLAPRDAGPHINLGIAFAAKGIFDESIAQYQRAIQLNPNRPEPHCYLANALVLKGRLDEAIREYQFALQIQPDFAPARTGLADARSKTGTL